MLPRALLSASVGVDGAEIVPRYLGPRDEPWLRALLDVYAAFEGRERSALTARLGEPLGVRAPNAPCRVARHVLDRSTRAPFCSPVSPAVARAVVFRRAALEPDRRVALEQAGAELALEPSALEELLFADLRSREHVGPVPRELSPMRLAQDANLAIVMGLLARAQTLRVRAFGNTRALVRHAQLVGLICTASVLPDGVELEISGPFALFRHTLIYGKRLASLVPRAAWCERFEIEARCTLGPGAALVTYRLRSGDPLPPARELSRYDSQVEARFARDFARLGSNWDLVREPEPVPLGGGRLIFPDFALVHRHDPARRFLLEIVGFWTESYLTDKLARLREARLESLILCIDERRGCLDDAIPASAQVLGFRRKLDAARVLARLEERDDRPGTP